MAPTHLSFVRVAAATVLILSSIITIDATAQPASTVNDDTSVRIFTACKRTDYPEVCMGTAKPMQKSRAVNMQGIAKTSIEATIDKTTHAKTTVASLMDSKADDKLTHSNLQVCHQMYHDAIAALKASVKNLDAKAHAELMDNLSAAMSSYSACDDAFTETPGSVSPLADTNAQLSKLTSNSLALADALKHV